MKKVLFGKEAAVEFEKAAIWYENEQVGLGNKFTSAVETAIQLLNEPNPPLTTMPGTAGRMGAKKLILHRFPFSLVVIENESHFYIIALAHHARKPGYWQERKAP